MPELGVRTSGSSHCRRATKQTAAAQETQQNTNPKTGKWEMGKRGRLLLFIHTKLPAAKSLMPVGLQNPLRKLIQSVPLWPEMQPLRASTTHILLLHFPLHPVACMWGEDEDENEDGNVNVDLAVHVDADGFIKTNCYEFKGLPCNDADGK